MFLNVFVFLFLVVVEWTGCGGRGGLLASHLYRVWRNAIESTRLAELDLNLFYLHNNASLHEEFHLNLRLCQLCPPEQQLWRKTQTCPPNEAAAVSLKLVTQNSGSTLPWQLLCLKNTWRFQWLGEWLKKKKLLFNISQRLPCLIFSLLTPLFPSFPFPLLF